MILLRFLFIALVSSSALIFAGQNIDDLTIQMQILSLNQLDKQEHPSDQLINVIRQISTQTTKPGIDAIVKRIQAEGHSVKSCMQYICNEKKHKALMALFQEWKLTEENFLDIKQKTAYVQNNFSQKPAKSPIKFSFSDKAYETIAAQIDKIHTTHCPSILTEVNINPTYDLNMSVNYCGDLTKPYLLSLAPNWHTIDPDMRNAILLHEFMHIVLCHNWQGCYIIDIVLDLLKNNTTDNIDCDELHEKIKKSDSYLQLKRAQEFEADCYACLTDKDVARNFEHFLKTQIDKDMQHATKGDHPTNAKRCLWTHRIYRLTHAEEKSKKRKQYEHIIGRIDSVKKTKLQ